MVHALSTAAKAKPLTKNFDGCLLDAP